MLLLLLGDVISVSSHFCLIINSYMFKLLTWVESRSVCKLVDVGRRGEYANEWMACSHYGPQSFERCADLFLHIKLSERA